MKPGDLDERYLPQAASALRGFVERATARRDALRTRLRGVSPVLPPGLVPEALVRLDDRLARSGPLGVLARSPQYGALLLCALLLVGTSLALAGPDESVGTPPAAVSTPGTLGPALGTSVEDYVTASRRDAVEASRDDPDAVRLALISLAEYAKPSQVAAVAEGLVPLRAYLRVPSTEATEVLSADVTALEADLQALYAATAERKDEDAAELAALAETIEPTGPQQQQFRDFYATSSTLAASEAKAYRSDCACVFALLVQGPASELASLTALSGVRAVELAAPGALSEQLRVLPLAPEQVGIVGPDAAPRPQTPLGGATAPGG